MTDSLALERRSIEDGTKVVGDENVTVLLTPPITPDYWTYRVVVADGQAIVGFGKFGTIGVGFAVEDDGDEASWNTNLPFTQDTAKIAGHIWCNRGRALSLMSEPLARVTVHNAIRMVQSAAFEDFMNEARRTDNTEHLARLIEQRLRVFGVPAEMTAGNSIVDSGMCV